MSDARFFSLNGILYTKGRLGRGLHWFIRRSHTVISVKANRKRTQMVGMKTTTKQDDYDTQSFLAFGREGQKRSLIMVDRIG